MDNVLNNSIDKLSKDFSNLDFSYHLLPNNDKVFNWLGEDYEDISICVLKTKYINEGYHKQDYFFFNYAYKNNYQALSQKYNNLITIYENECYTSQPNCGYAIKGTSQNDNIVIIGVLIKKETFFREYLPMLSSDNSMFHFFLDPQTNKYSDEYIRLSFKDDLQIRTLLEMMVIEYANKKDDTQIILKPMVLTLLMLIARKYKLEQPKISNSSLSDKIIQYINEHSENITLNQIAKYFSYHPNYISSLLHKNTGLTFSQILLEKRMNKAIILLRNTTLSIEEISSMLGYSNTSNFYKAFKEYFNSSPREYIK